MGTQILARDGINKFSRTILLADSDKTFTGYISHFIAYHHFQVVAAESLVQIKTLMLNREFGILIISSTLPGNGLVRFLHGVTNGPGQTPSAIMIAKNDGDNKSRNRIVSVRSFPKTQILHQPFSPDELLEAMAKTGAS